MFFGREGHGELRRRRYQCHAATHDGILVVYRRVDCHQLTPLCIREFGTALFCQDALKLVARYRSFVAWCIPPKIDFRLYASVYTYATVSAQEVIHAHARDANRTAMVKVFPFVLLRFIVGIYTGCTVLHVYGLFAAHGTVADLLRAVPFRNAFRVEAVTT
jgi:hypothetical protein